MGALSPWIEVATAAAISHASTDPVYAELMATYAALGELLDSSPTPDYVEDCQALVDRTVALQKRIDVEYVHRLAAGRARLAVGNAA